MSYHEHPKGTPLFNDRDEFKPVTPLGVFLSGLPIFVSAPLVALVITFVLWTLAGFPTRLW
jgi:hypothetical protein